MNRPGTRAAANGTPVPEDIVFGCSEAMQSVRRMVERVAGASVPVLILGESGTGKELIANQIHRRSPWSQGPFVKVSCPAIPGTLLESELFGYEKGAFTGAWSSKPGRVELAHRGTLFLDEIGEMDMSLQAKLLQLLQDGQFSRIGGREDTQVDVRVVCATNRDLEEEIAAGNFREDLFYRINIVNIKMPPLRQRAEDIPALVDYFLHSYNGQYGRSTRAVSKEVLHVLCQYSWPGNIRELQNQVRRYVVIGSEDELVRDLSNHRDNHRHVQIDSNGLMPLKLHTKRAVEEVERNLILRVLQENNWNRKQSAHILQISYRALLYKIKKAGLPSKRQRIAVPVAHERALQYDALD